MTGKNRHQRDGVAGDIQFCRDRDRGRSFGNPDVDRELEAARQASDPAERLPHYAKVAERILADRPLTYLWHGKYLYAMTTKLAGFTPYPDGLIRPQGIRMQ